MICGPSALLAWTLRDAGWGWGSALPVLVLLYAFLRLLSGLAGMDAALEGRRGDKQALLLAKRAEQTPSTSRGSREQSQARARGRGDGRWCPDGGPSVPH